MFTNKQVVREPMYRRQAGDHNHNTPSPAQLPSTKTSLLS
jgi:hypothetical protein